MKRRMLFISGVDLASPFAGEEEYLIHEWLKKVSERFEVTVLSAAFVGGGVVEVIDGVTYLRIGSKRIIRGEFDWRMIWDVFKYYRRQIRGKQKYDLVIERWDKGPFLFGIYGDKETVLMINNLWRERWRRVLPWYVSFVFQHLLEPLFLWVLRESRVMTLNKKVKRKLLSLGFEKGLIEILKRGTTFRRVGGLVEVRKYKVWTMISAGVVEPGKNFESIFRVFQKVKEMVPEFRWVIVGVKRREYWEKILSMIEKCGYGDSVEYLGPMERWRMMRVIRRSFVMLVNNEVEADSARGQGTVVVEADDEIEKARGIVKLYRDKKWYRRCQERQLLVLEKIDLERSKEGFETLVQKWSRVEDKKSLRVGVLGFAH